MDRQSTVMAQHTPNRRKFGTKLSANSPLPSSTHRLQQQQKQRSATNLSPQKVQQSVSIKSKSAKKKNFPPKSGSKSTLLLESSKKKKTSYTKNNRQTSSLNLLSTPGVYQTPYIATPSSISPAIKSIQKGKNLFDNFNSPSIVDDNTTNNNNGSGITHNSGSNSSKKVEGKWSHNFTPKISWKQVASSSSSPKQTKQQSSSSTTSTSSFLAYSTINATSLSYSPPEKNNSVGIIKGRQNNDNTIPGRGIISPTSASILSSSSTTKRPVASSVNEKISIGPSEYGIIFPSNEKSLHLELESVTVTSGQPTGCSIARILPKFDLDNVRYIHNNTGSASSKIQVNDLLVSINGISVLSQKYQVITDLLYNKYYNKEKIIVFRSIDKLSRGGGGGEGKFSRRTMRNIRTGKRVATALNDDAMENGELLTWVETPTQVELRGRSKKSGNVGKEKKDVMRDPPGHNEVTEQFFSPRTKLASIDEVATQITLESPSATSLSSAQYVLTPSTLGTAASSLAGSPSFLFSPSNVKRMSSTSRVVFGRGEEFSPPSFSPGALSSSPLTAASSMRSPLSSGKRDALPVTVKKSNVQVERIGKVLVGEDTLGNSRPGDFEHSLRLKKGVLNELKSVHLELERLQSINEKQGQTIHVLKEKESYHKSSLQEIRKLSKNVKSTLQSQLEDSNAHIRELVVHVQALEQSDQISKDTIAKLQKELAQKQELLDEQVTVCEMQLNDIDRVETLLSGIKGDRDDFDVKLSQLTMDLADTKTDLAEAKEDLEEERMKSNKLDASRVEQIRVLEERLAMVESKDQADDDNVMLRETTVNLETSIRQKDKEIVELKTERDLLETTVQKKTEEVDSLKEAVLSWHKEVVQIKEQVSTLSQERDQAMADMATHVRESQLNTTVKSLEGQIKELETEVDRVHIDLKNADIEKEAVETKLRETTAELHITTKQNTDQVSKLSEEITSSNDLIAQLKVKVSLLSEEKDDLVTKVFNASKDEKVPILEELLLEEQNKSLAVTVKLEEVGNQLDKVTTKLELVKQEKEDVEDKMKEANIELETVIKHKTKEMDELNEMITQLNDTVSSLTEALITANESLETERSQLNERVLMLELKVKEGNASKAELQSKLEILTSNQASSMIEIKTKLATAESMCSDSQAGIMMLKTEIANKEKTLTSLTAEIEQSKQEFDDERESFVEDGERKKDEIATLQSKQSKLTDHANDLTLKLQSSQSDAVNTKAKLMIEFSELSKQLIESQDDFSQSKALVADLKSKLNTAESLLDESDTEIQSLSDDCERLENQVNDLNALLMTSEETVAQLKDEHQSQSIEIESLTTSRDTLQEQNEMLTSDLKSSGVSLNEKILSLTDDIQLKDAENKSLLKELEESQNQSNALVTDLQTKLESSDALLGETSVDRSRLEQQVNDLNILIENAETVQTKQKNEIESLSVELISMTMLRDDCLDETETLAVEVKSKECEIRSLVDKVSMLTNQLQSMKTSHTTEKKEWSEKLSTSQDDSKAVVADLESKLDSLKVSLNAANIDNCALTNNCERFEKQANDLNMLLENTECTLSHQKLQNESLEMELASLSSLRDELRRDKDSMAAELESNVAEISSLSERIRALMNQVSLGDNNRTELSSKATTMEIDLVKVNSRLDSQQNCLKSKEAEISTLQSQLREVHAKVKDLTDSKQQSEYQYQSEIKSYKSRQSQLLSLKSDLEVTIKKLTTQIEHTKAQFNREVLSRDVKQNNLMKDIQDLQNAVSASKIKCSHLTTELEAVNKSLSTKDSELMAMTKQKDDMVKELEMTIIEARKKEDASQSKERELSTLLATQECEFKKQEACRAGLTKRLESLTLSIKSKEQEIYSLQSELASYKETTTLLKSQGEMSNDALETALNNARASFNDERNSMKRHIQELEQQLEQTRNALSTQEQNGIDNDEKHASALTLLNDKISKAKKVEKDLQTKAQEMKHLLKARQDKIDKLANDLSSSKMCHSELVDERRILEQRLSHLAKEVDIYKQESAQLKSMLQEGVALNASLSDKSKEKERVLGDQSAEMKRMTAKIQSLEQSKEELIKDISEKEANEEMLQSKLEETHLELVQLSMDLACMREDAVVTISETKNEADEVVRRIVKNYGVKEDELKRKVKSLNREQEEAISHLNQSHIEQMNRLKEQCNDARILNKSLAARLEVASVLDKRDKKLDKMMDIVQTMDTACAKYCADDTLTGVELQRRDNTIQCLKEDLSLSRNKITALMQEIERGKEERASLQSDWSSFQNALHKLVVCIDEESTLSIDELPEMTSLLDTLLSLFQAKADQVSSLQSQIQDMESSQANKAIEFDQLIDEINSVQERLSPLLSSHHEIINSDDNGAIMNTVEHELRDICIQVEAQVDCDSSLSQHEVIYGMLHSLKVAVSSSSVMCDKTNLLSDSGDHELVCEFLSEIEEAKEKVLDLDHKLSSESNCRKKYEMQCKSKEQMLVEAEEKITTLEKSIKVLDETKLIQTQEIKVIKLKLEHAQDKHGTLETSIKDLNAIAQSKSKEVKELESNLQRTRDDLRKSELNYERAQSEIESCQSLAIELKTIIIEKNKAIESKEGQIMEFQYRIDEISAKTDGWKASLEGIVTDDNAGISSPDDIAKLMAINKERQDTLSSKVSELEEQCLRMSQDSSQQASMHKAIVEGLESQCGLLSDDYADICLEISEKQDYITTLEEAKGRLEVNVDILKKEKNEAHRTLSDLQKSLGILRQQKLDSDTMRNELYAAVKYLTNVALVHSTKLEGFTAKITLSTSNSWSESVEYITQFIEHAASKLNQNYSQVAAEVVTPKAKGASDSFYGVSNFTSQHSDMLEDLKSMKTALANVMTSPKFTPMKEVARQEQSPVHGTPIDEYGEKLYQDLFRAHEQMASLSTRIEEDQMHWEDREACLLSRIQELEEEIENNTKVAASLDASVENADELPTSKDDNFEQRYQRAIVRRAFQTWKTQTRMSKHMKIAKEMAKELAQTRKKVLLLKTHLEDGS